MTDQPIDFASLHEQYNRVESKLRALANLKDSGGFTDKEVAPVAELVATELEELATAVRGK